MRTVILILATLLPVAANAGIYLSKEEIQAVNRHLNEKTDADAKRAKRIEAVQQGKATVERYVVESEGVNKPRNMTEERRIAARKNGTSTNSGDSELGEIDAVIDKYGMAAPVLLEAMRAKRMDRAARAAAQGSPAKTSDYTNTGLLVAPRREQSKDGNYFNSEGTYSQRTPDGSYMHSGGGYSQRMPDGSYIHSGGSYSQRMPDGSYIHSGGSYSQRMPDGSYIHSGGGYSQRMPDGSYSN